MSGKPRNPQEAESSFNRREADGVLRRILPILLEMRRFPNLSRSILEHVKLSLEHDIKLIFIETNKLIAFQNEQDIEHNLHSSILRVLRYLGGIQDTHQFIQFFIPYGYTEQEVHGAISELASKHHISRINTREMNVIRLPSSQRRG